MPGIGNLLPCLSLLCRRALQDRVTFATLSLPLPPFIAMITLATIVPLIGWMLETLLLSQIKQLQCCKHTGPHSNCLCPCQYGRKQLTRKTRSMKNCTACPWSWMQDHKECYYEGTPLGNQRLARQRGRPNWQRRTREPNWEATQQTMEFIDQPSDIAQSVIPHSGTRQQHSTEEATYFDWHSGLAEVGLPNSLSKRPMQPLQMVSIQEDHASTQSMVHGRRPRSVGSIISCAGFLGIHLSTHLFHLLF